MTLKELSEWLQRTAPAALDKLIRRDMPRRAGVLAVSHFKENFRKGGFVNNGLQPWKPAKRIGRSKAAGDNYKTLTSGRNHLMNSIYYVAGDYAAVVRNPVEYAAIHNEGGVVQPTVTPKMRKFAWAKFYTAAGLTKGEKIPASVPEEAARWRALALTKKTKLNITMPRRQFIGVSRELEDKISASLEAELLRLFEN